jgi:GNAT superfamily N-acetyltransferase
MTDQFSVREVSRNDYEGWKTIAACYDGWDEPINEKKLEAIWQNLLNTAIPSGCLIADSAGAVVGFLHYVTYPIIRNAGRDRTFECYIEDVFVAEIQRRRGIARLLFNQLEIVGRQSNWFRINWKTSKDNLPAQKLYDGIVARDDSIYYKLKL